VNKTHNSSSEEESSDSKSFESDFSSKDINGTIKVSFGIEAVSHNDITLQVQGNSSLGSIYRKQQLTNKKWDREGPLPGFMMRRWFSVDPNIDQYVRLLFKNDLDSIGELLHWEKDQKGRLALILICD
jgi:hypothetical protein